MIAASTNPDPQDVRFLILMMLLVRLVLLLTFIGGFP